MQQVPEALPPGPGEIRVAVAWCGLCGSDLHEYLAGPFVIPTVPHPVTGQQAPVVLGHEISGVVESGSRTLAPGTHVALNALLPCGHCPACRSTRPNICRTLGHLGFSAQGGLAPWITVPETMALPAPPGLPLDHLALAEPVSVAVRTVRHGRVRPSDRVLVIGAGSIGLAAAQVTRARTAAQVTVTDIAPARLARARTLGLDTALPDDIDGCDTFDVVLDCAGSRSTPGFAVRVVRNGGRIVLAGLPQSPCEIDVANLVLKEATIATAVGHLLKHDLAPAVALLSSGDIVADVMITSRIPLEASVSHGLNVLADPSSDQVKILVDVAMTTRTSLKGEAHGTTTGGA
ncbi:alcohol dehydrogenase catalytic domain-containing protein [Nonomuraea sp. H19]|uniref:alcohol dehydrogenase catalytic domain-containing protein n=1 Tax=Nonomuraea sp. H19 TaxID=3452206 RepID=UPI003F8B4308